MYIIIYIYNIICNIYIYITYNIIYIYNIYINIYIYIYITLLLIRLFKIFE